MRAAHSSQCKMVCGWQPRCCLFLLSWSSAMWSLLWTAFLRYVSLQPLCSCSGIGINNALQVLCSRSNLYLPELQPYHGIYDVASCLSAVELTQHFNSNHCEHKLASMQDAFLQDMSMSDCIDQCLYQGNVASLTLQHNAHPWSQPSAFFFRRCLASQGIPSLCTLRTCLPFSV